MNIRCHIIEDEPMARSLLELYVHRVPELELVKVSEGAIQALDTIKTNTVDLVFLDIRMPEMTGLELLNVLENPPLVIMTTAYSEFALESYELDVVDYLKKPITFERFLKAIKRVELRLLHRGPVKEKPTVIDYIFVKEGTRFVKLMISDILFIEGLKNYVTIHTAHAKIVSLQRLKSLEDQLPWDKFIRVHNSYIVSKSAISSVKESEIYLGATKIPIGETYFKTFMDFVNGLHLR